MASGSQDGSIKVWETLDGSELYELKGHSGAVHCMVLLQNGWLASASADASIKLWNLSERKEIKALLGHETPVVSLAVLKNGNLVSGSLDGNIKVWNPTVQVKNLPVNIKGPGKTHEIFQIGILSNSNIAAVTFSDSGKDGSTLCVWNSSSGKTGQARPYLFARSLLYARSAQ